MDGLLIGRFQPFHLGHVHAVECALSAVENLWIGIGSSNRPAEKSNPFSAAERQEMIEQSLSVRTARRTAIYHIPDLDDHKRWMESLDGIVPAYDAVFTNDEMTKHLYAKRGVRVRPIEFLRRDELSGSRIRNVISTGQDWRDLVPAGTRAVLERIDARRRLKGL